MTATNRFNIIGIERVKFAVSKLDDALRFATDWGLQPVVDIPGNSHLFCTADGSEVEVVEADAADPNRRPIGDASGLVALTWGVSDAAALKRLASELQRDRQVTWDEQGGLHSVDDLGISQAFRVAQRHAAPYEPTRFNSPGLPDRINRRASRYERAYPHEISHIAIGVDDAGAAAHFYIERLGFVVSDRYANRGVFLRCAPAGNHHHLFLVNARTAGTRFNHLAFKVRDIHEVIAGGQALDGKGWVTFAGPGRHMVSSACFWYFQSPFGGSWEYAADEDIVGEDWESNDFAAQSHIFSEWTFGLEKSDGTLRGPISMSKEKPLE